MTSGTVFRQGNQGNHPAVCQRTRRLPGLTAQEALEVILCDAKGNMNAFATEKTERVAVVDNDILSNVNTEKWSKETIEQAKTAARNTLSKFSEGIIVNGITRKVNHDSKKEFTRSKYTQHLANSDMNTFADKIRMADIIDDVVYVSSGWGRDGGLKHKRNERYVDFDHGTALVMAGDNKYSVEVIVGITDSKEYIFYDVTNNLPGYYKIKEGFHTNAATDRPIGAVNRNPSNENDTTERRGCQAN